MRIVFMGTPESAVPSLRQLLADGHEVIAVWTQPDKPAGRGDKMHASPVKTFALGEGLRVEQPRKIRTDDAKSLFASYDAELAVVVAYGRILPREFLNSPKYGCVNVHFSLLPKYRGAAPVNWAIINGENETGVTTMVVEEELDSGPILLQHHTSIAVDETATELMARLSESGAQLLSKTLSKFSEIKPVPQDHSNATFAPLLTKAAGLIDWSQTAVEIERRVRGLQPWPNAYSNWNQQRIIIWKSKVALQQHDEPSGSVLLAHGDEITVACGQRSALRILELQLEGKRRMPARDFLNGMHLKIGDSFGH